jgi:hypothetical protein
MLKFLGTHLQSERRLGVMASEGLPIQVACRLLKVSE